MNDAQWYVTKKEVDKLSNDFNNMINNYSLNEPGSVKDELSGKYRRIQVTLTPINGAEVWLLVFQHKQNGVKEAWYIAFNKSKNVVYRRDLLKENAGEN